MDMKNSHINYVEFKAKDLEKIKENPFMVGKRNTYHQYLEMLQEIYNRNSSMVTRAPIEAFARLKPSARSISQAGKVLYTVDEQDTLLSIHMPRDLQKGVIANNSRETYAFRFAGVFHEEAS